MAGLDTSAAPAQPILAAPRSMSVGGIVPMQSLAATLAQRDADVARQADATRNTPVITGLAGYVTGCWQDAKQAKRDVEDRMIAALRARRGEYDPLILSQIKQSGGSEIYMKLFATKARQLGALLRDVLVGAGTDKPWTLAPTPDPELPDDYVQEAYEASMSKAMQAEMSGVPMSVADIRSMLNDLRDEALNTVRTEATNRCRRMEAKMEDQLVQGGWLTAFDDFIDDLSTFPTAIMRGPVVRKKSVLAWVQNQPGVYEVDVQERMTLEWDRVSPLDIYPARGSSGPNDKYLIERHRGMSPAAFTALKGVEGYDDAAISAMLAEHAAGGLREWMSIDVQRDQLEQRTTSTTAYTADDGIDALQFWGPVLGRKLIEWGMTGDKITDPDQTYEAEVWLVGRHVIKAVLNTDPLKRRGYYTTGFERVPGSFWHNSLYDTIKDVCDMCNSAARALSNNMGIASGPQVVYNVDRLPNGATVTSLYPWKIHQVKDDLTGSSLKPIEFFQPSSNAAELMAVYDKFSVMADEHSGLPRYMTGGEGTGGAGRTASGLAMMVGNASKTIKSLVANIDINVTTPSVQRLYYYNMRYLDDPELKGDVEVVARGALSLVTKESAQVRRIEFLARTANPIDMQIMKPEGRAYILRETARALDLDVDKIVPSITAAKLDMLAMQGMDQPAMPQPEAPPAGPGQALANGQQITDNFTPQPQ